MGVKWKSAYSGLGMDEQTEYEAHVAAANEANKGMPAVMVSHGGVGEGSVAKDIRMENFSISMGGRELINEASVTLAYGRRYGTLVCSCIFLSVFWSLFLKIQVQYMGSSVLLQGSGL